MSKEQLTDNDRELIEMAYETTYRSSLNNYIRQADTELCRSIIREIMHEMRENLEQ